MISKRMIPVLVILSAVCAAFAQAAPESAGWKLAAQSNLTLALNTYSDNWAGTELGSMSWIAQFNGNADRTFSNNYLNKNTLKLSFGQTAFQEKNSTGSKEWGDLDKSTDLVDFESILILPWADFIQPFVAGRALSQFLDKADSSDTQYFNPMEFTESFGAAKELMKSAPVTWNSRLGAAVKQKVNRHSPLVSASGLDYETKVINEGGLELVSEWKGVNEAKWLTYSSLLRLYEALISSVAEETDNTAMADYWRYPDLTWDNTLTMSLSKYIMFNVNIQLLYDKEVDSGVRFKDIFSVGLTYNFIE